MKLLTALFFMSVSAFAAWQMFSDQRDTYIYNTNTGEIYIRVDMGQENYKDKFIKMPIGQSAQSIEGSTSSSDTLPLASSSGNYSKEELDKIKDEANKLKSTIYDSVLK